MYASVKPRARLYPRAAAACKPHIHCVCFRRCLEKGLLSRIPAFDQHTSERLSRKGEGRRYNASPQTSDKSKTVELLVAMKSLVQR